MGSLGWHGVAEVDFRWDGKEVEPVLIEVNPRFWGGLTQSVASGWDYPYLLYRLAIDGTVAAVDPTNNDPNSIHAKTETPVMALLATLTEIAQDDTQMEAMRQAFEELKLEFGPGSRLHALRDFFERLKHGVDVKARWEHARMLAARPSQHGVRRPLVGRPAAGARRAVSAGGVHEAWEDLDGAAGVVRRLTGEFRVARTGSRRWHGSVAIGFWNIGTRLENTIHRSKNQLFCHTSCPRALENKSVLHAGCSKRPRIRASWRKFQNSLLLLGSRNANKH